MKIGNLTRQHGFTLIELLIVLAIIATRAAVAIAGYYIGMQNRVRRMALIHEKSFFTDTRVQSR